MLILSNEHFEQMVAHARAGLPNESCGLFAGTITRETKTVKAVYCLKNTDANPEHFSMAPEDQFNAIKDIRKNGWTLLGNFHSHPASPARPSEEDIRLAFDPSLSYIIISLKDPEPVLKSFIIRAGTVAEEPVQV
ncbi:Mov34/MPN/PAD-1 family protein [Spirochaetia bacterium]|nr:Mov34/MPN/PAD-1 family protein [Spirochaetia bacterium]